MERHSSLRFDSKAKDYKDLQEILKKIIKTEENIVQTRANFKKKWLEIANIENNQDLSRGLTSYSKALEGIERTHRDAILTMKSNVLENLKKLPNRLKDQRRSLSAHGKAVKDYEESEVKLQRILSIKDQRNLNLKERSDAAGQVEEKKNIMHSTTNNLEKDLRMSSKMHDEDVKNMIMLISHAKISYHASAIQLYTEAFKEILSIREN